MAGNTEDDRRLGSRGRIVVWGAAALMLLLPLFGDAAVVGTDHVTEILEIESGCQHGGTDRIAEHDGEQSTFGCGGEIVRMDG